MRKNISSLMTSKNILIALTVLCCFFIGTSFFTDTLTKPLKKCVSMVVVPVQKGMNNIGFWVYDKYQLFLMRIRNFRVRSMILQKRITS